MGFLSPCWRETFFNTNPEQFFHDQDMLRKHDLPSKTRTEDHVFRESRNNLDGRTPMLTRVHFDLGSDDEYRIFVVGGNTAAARSLLQNSERTDR